MMNINKTALCSAMALVMGGVGVEANASLTTGTILDFTGSFTMQVSPTLIIPTPISSGPDGGIIIGVAQDTNGHASHGGTKAHLQGGLDFEWTFFSNSGMHFTTTGPTVVNDNGTQKDLDFSGWRVTWNAIPSINMGGGFQDCGTSTDGICANLGTDIAGTYDNGSGLASITCSSSSCSASSTFTLTYNAVVPQDDPSGFGGVNYGVNLTGHVVAAVPVPAAAWLFGSGLLGLAGVARRRKS